MDQTADTPRRDIPRQVIPGIAELMQEAQRNPPKPVIQGLLHEHEIVGLHGAPEAFKTVFSLQLAESLGTGTPFLGIWPVPRPLPVYFFETEMSVSAIGKRLLRMYPADKTFPERLKFADEKRLRQFKRAPDLAAKFNLLNGWVAEAESEIVILDTCNPFFRGKQSPNEETTAGDFFDRLEAMPVSTKSFVRHNHKPRIDDTSGDGASRIRGSGQFADVPDLLLELRRTDKRIHKVELAITKFRHGHKPDDMTLWFDSGDFRLTALPPAIHLLRSGPQSRKQLVEALSKRFGIGQRLADEMIAQERPFLQEYQKGHERVFALDLEAAKSATWYCVIADCLL